MLGQLVLMGVMVVAALLGSLGQIMLKRATDVMNGSFFSLLTNWYLWCFFLLYGVAVLINIVAYRLGGKVQFLYPMISLSYIFAAFLSWKLLGESIGVLTWIGSVIIVIGVSIIGYSAV